MNSRAPNGAPARFWRGQVWPRRSRVIIHWHILLAVLVAITVTAAASRLPLGDLQISTIAGSLLAFASLSFGACITGAVLVLTLPQDTVIEALVRRRREGESFTHYSDLVFSFAWSAAVQLTLVVIVGGMFLLGGDGSVWPDNVPASHTVLVFLAAAVSAYSVIRLFNVVSTLSALSVVVVAFLTHGVNDKESTEG